MKKVNKEQLKEAVNKVAPQLPENVVFIAAARQIKNGQIECEFVQSRSLAGRKTSMLALLNQGDARFNSGRTTMRVWSMVNVESFKAVFGEIEGLDFAAVAEAIKTCTTDERISILKQVENINVNGLVQPVKIVCLETIDVATLPKSIREQLADENVSDEIKARYILQTKEGESIVDERGNKVYRRYELAYGDAQDVLVEGKVLVSELAKKEAGVSSTKATNALISALADEEVN